ncbi:anti-sigma-I factor RsgI family protein [Pseudobacteroides cellulosolvens]|uniref:RsgI N-terminal anti-sigma domain-containing protein n=1 Tax=Pseudobacteroides cellulosolvens ATCC 35603 = DSM 2933 TaxID=398512 RepID=A0A0L6JRV5_9FIRM|nr:STAS/SEC14 domain-containing protein [Pseudobacteroides cellulosolvens]KNY28127.1 hypothetical protein Bccel_3398 [Pseudobacteroides cellulosolvens ATCC 35603 = DSM 2933]
MRSKGIVLEIDKIGAVVINNEGNYIRIKKNNKLIPGVLVEYTENDVINKKQTLFLRVLRENSKIAYAIGSAAVFIFIVALFAIISRQALGSTFAYIDVDINPSVEFKINKSNSIVGVKSLNKDGEKLCQSIDFIGKKVENGIVEIINRSAELGYFKDKNRLVLVAGALQVDGKMSTEKYEKLNKEMEDLIGNIKDKIKHENKEVQLVAFHTSPIKLKEAHVKNMSLGRYSLYDNADNQGIKLALEDAKKLKISDLFNLLPTKDYTYFEEEQRQEAIDKEEIKEIIKDDKVSSKNKQQDEEIASNKSESSTKNSKGNNSTVTKEPATKNNNSSKSVSTATPEPTPGATHGNINYDRNDKKNNENKPDSTPVNRGKSDVTAIAQIQTPTPLISRPSENKTESKEPQDKNDNEDSNKSNNGNGNSNKENSTKNNNKHTPEPAAITPIPEVSDATPKATPVTNAGNSSSSPSVNTSQVPSAVISTPAPTASSGKNNSGRNETAPGQVKKNSDSSSKGQGSKNGKN